MIEIDLNRMHPDFAKILEMFKTRYGLKQGIFEFKEFVTKNELHTDRPYAPQFQYESFEWTHPLISYYKSDSEARYYKVEAIHTIISLNNRDYRDVEAMRKSASSMAWRPINLNHDHQKWLPFPACRVDTSAFEDFCIEAIIRIDNSQKHIQEMLDNGKILHPSIECRKHSEGYTFTSLALLIKGEALAGDPLSTIQPLFTEKVNFTDLNPKTSEKQRLLKVIHEQSETISELKESVAVQRLAIEQSRKNFRRLRGIAKSMAKALDENGIVEADNNFNIRSYNEAIKEACKEETLRNELANTIFEIGGTKYVCDSEGALQPI